MKRGEKTWERGCLPLLFVPLFFTHDKFIVSVVPENMDTPPIEGFLFCTPQPQEIPV